MGNWGYFTPINGLISPYLPTGVLSQPAAILTPTATATCNLLPSGRGRASSGGRSGSSRVAAETRGLASSRGLASPRERHMLPEQMAMDGEFHLGFPEIRGVPLLNQQKSYTSGRYTY